MAFAEQVAGLAIGVGAQVGVDGGPGGGGDQALQGWQHLLWQRELNGNRVELGDGKQPLGVAHAQEVAFVHVADAHAATDRGANLGIGKLYLSRINGRLIALHRGLELVDQCLLLVIGLFRHTVVDA